MDLQLVAAVVVIVCCALLAGGVIGQALETRRRDTAIDIRDRIAPHTRELSGPDG